ncbi:MAG: hypothetical protein AAF653_05615 [Chloroflexota bacterium]
MDIRITKRQLVAGLTLVAVLAFAPVYLFAQDIGSYQPRPDDDGRLNYDINDFMDGIGVYCADSTRTPWDTYEDGGGFVVLAPSPEDSEGKEILWVTEEAILAGIAQTEATGEYSVLGQAEGTWFDPQPAIYYLSSGEFQLNVIGGDSGKLFEFQWTECRGVPKVTNDGCPPGKDPGGEGDNAGCV